MKKMKVIFGLMLISSIVFASQTVTVKSAVCASGKLNPERTLKIGDTYLLEDLKKISSEQVAILEAGKDVVLVAKVSGGENDGGACSNRNLSTMLTVTLSK